MITDTNYNSGSNQQNDIIYSRYAHSITSYSQQAAVSEEEKTQEHFSAAGQTDSTGGYPNNEFINALENNDLQVSDQQYNHSALEADDPDNDFEDDQDLDPDDLDDDLTERYDENDSDAASEPETFSDDGYKID